ncbi:MAG: HupE/UreJ family protein, partial [Gammaproteobacteria bacterium]|nr:HupE/UreJ family protein [Gammaproteobacteria bacterium]
MLFLHSINLHKLILLLIALLSIATVHAHQMRPAIVTISFQQNAVVQVQVQTNIEAILSGIGAEHENTDDAPQAEVYRELRELPAAELTEKFKGFAGEFSNALSLELAGKPVTWKLLNINVPVIGDTRLSRKSEIEYTAKIPSGAATAVWSYNKKFGDAVVSFMSQGQAGKATFWLVKGQQSPQYQLYEKLIPRSWFDVAKNYVGLGTIHILPKGLDHILFVLGLFLLSQKFKPLLWQVT